MTDSRTDMRLFTMFRRNVPLETHDANQRNAPDEPAFEGVVFSDGSCALRWRTAVRSTSVWASLDDALAIHGHPEYESELVWHAATAIPAQAEGWKITDAMVEAACIAYWQDDMPFTRDYRWPEKERETERTNMRRVLEAALSASPNPKAEDGLLVHGLVGSGAKTPEIISADYSRGKRDALAAAAEIAEKARDAAKWRVEQTQDRDSIQYQSGKMTAAEQIASAIRSKA